MSSISTRDLVSAYFRYVNNEDWQLLAGLIHADARWTRPASPMLIGRQQMLAGYLQLLEPFPQHIDDPVRVLVSDETAAVDIHFTGVTAEGKTIEFDAIDVFEFGDHTIHRLSTWYDIDAITSAMSGT